MNTDKIKFGCPVAPADSRDRVYKPRLDQTIFLDIDLRPLCPAVRNQKNLGACTAFGTTSLFNFVRMKHGLPAWLPSPLFTYYATREKYGEQNLDNGAYVRDALKSTVKDGVAMERVWPYVTNRFTEKPSPAVYADAEKHQTLEYLSIPSSLRSSLLFCLSEGYPFVFGIQVYPSFMNSNDGIIPVPDKTKEASVGGHCMLCVGYKKNSDGVEVLIVQNSWSSLWGDNGYCYIPLSYFMDSAYDVWTIRNTEAPADDTSDPVEPDPAPSPEPPAPVPEPVVPVPPAPTPDPVVPVPPAPNPAPTPVADEPKISRMGIVVILIFILLSVLFTILK